MRSRAVVVPDSPAELFGSFAGAVVVGQAAASLDIVGRSSSFAEWQRWTGLELQQGRMVGPLLYEHPVTGWEAVEGCTASKEISAFGRREGPVWRVEVSPGSIAFRVKDYGKADRTDDRARESAFLAAQAEGRARSAVIGPLENRFREAVQRRRTSVRSWSRKSRSNMVQRLSTLDYEPMTREGAPAMLTLTYPGDWLAVAPSAAVCAQHVRKFQLRYKRRWGRPMVGVWKREFQRRGAPHYHILMVPPAGRLFDEWAARTWSAIVDAQSCGARQVEWGDRADCCERHRHEAAHLTAKTVDRREGARYADPRRVGVYFSKHGSFVAKDYQNEAPPEWLADETAGIGRFWGVWGLKPAVGVVEVPATVVDPLRRTVSRWQAATQLRDRSGRPAMVETTVWRKKQTVDRHTGEIGWRWVRRKVRKRMRPRLTSRSGFLALNDGPALAMQLGRYADQLAGKLPTT